VLNKISVLVVIGLAKPILWWYATQGQCLWQFCGSATASTASNDALYAATTAATATAEQQQQQQQQQQNSNGNGNGNGANGNSNSNSCNSNSNNIYFKIIWRYYLLPRCHNFPQVIYSRRTKKSRQNPILHCFVFVQSFNRHHWSHFVVLVVLAKQKLHPHTDTLLQIGAWPTHTHTHLCTHTHTHHTHTHTCTPKHTSIGLESVYRVKYVCMYFNIRVLHIRIQ